MATASATTDTASPAVVAAAAPTYEKAGMRVKSRAALTTSTASAMRRSRRC